MFKSNPKIRLEEAIVETIAFFDMFDFPLTVFELWQYAKVKSEVSEIYKIIISPEFSKKHNIEQNNGFYFFSGRGEIAQLRLNRYNFSERKFKRAVRIGRIFSYIPWIQLIAVGNMIGANNLKNQGDIDLFIVTDHKRLWLSRLCCVGIIKLLNLRPKPGRGKDTICLSFFITAQALDIKHLMLDKDDLYFVYWLAGLVPVLNRNNIYQRFMENNPWLKEYLPNWRPYAPNIRRHLNRRFNNFFKDVIDLLVGGLEQTFSKWQKKILPNSIKAAANKDTRVVIADSILKLHLNDRREYYSRKYIDRINNL